MAAPYTDSADRKLILQQTSDGKQALEFFSRNADVDLQTLQVGGFYSGCSMWGSLYTLSHTSILG